MRCYQIISFLLVLFLSVFLNTFVLVLCTLSFTLALQIVIAESDHQFFNIHHIISDSANQWLFGEYICVMVGWCSELHKIISKNCIDACVCDWSLFDSFYLSKASPKDSVYQINSIVVTSRIYSVVTSIEINFFDNPPTHSEIVSSMYTHDLFNGVLRIYLDISFDNPPTHCDDEEICWCFNGHTRSIQLRYLFW